MLAGTSNNLQGTNHIGLLSVRVPLKTFWEVLILIISVWERIGLKTTFRTGRKEIPTWKDGKGKGVIGAVNYITNLGMNTLWLALNECLLRSYSNFNRSLSMAN